MISDRLDKTLGRAYHADVVRGERGRAISELKAELDKDDILRAEAVHLRNGLAALNAHLGGMIGNRDFVSARRLDHLTEALNAQALGTQSSGP